MITKLNALNPELHIKTIRGRSFKRYGRQIHQIKVPELIAVLNKQTPTPESGNIYVASYAPLEETEAAHLIRSHIFGSMPIQVGYCNGLGVKMNAMEYHKCPEVLAAGTDLVLILGKTSDINNLRYDSDQVEIFFVEADSMIELYQDTLHYAPCRASSQAFKAVIVLAQGTNTPLEEGLIPLTQEDRLLFQKNKWLIAHSDSPSAIEQHAFAGIEGTNWMIKPSES